MSRSVDPHLLFILAFAETDLRRLDKREWVNLRGRLRRFLEGRRRLVDGFHTQSEERKIRGLSFDVSCHESLSADFPIRSADPLTATPEQFEEVQYRVKRIVDSVVRTRVRWERLERRRIRQLRSGSMHENALSRTLGGGGTMETLKIAVVVLPDVTAPPRTEWMQMSESKRPPLSEAATLSVSAGFSDAVVFQTCMTLWLLPTNTIRECSNPDCKRLFAAPRTDSKGCSTRCTRSLYWLGPKGRKKLREKYQKNGWQLGARRRRRTNNKNGDE